MDMFVIEGGRPLRGQIKISGSKNAALPIMTATMLAEDSCEISNVPNLRDVHTMARLMIDLGSRITFSRDRLLINNAALKSWIAPYRLVKTMRASIVVMGPLLARFGRVQVSLPGGCAIGARPIDIHLNAFAKLGVDIAVRGGNVHARAGKLRNRKRVVALPFPSVGATENILMYAATLPGRTVIDNAAREPEIVDLAEFLIAMGADIRGAGRKKITVDGVKRLAGTSYRVIPDRIEAGTYAVAAAITQGSCTLENLRPGHLAAVWEKLERAGAKLEGGETSMRVSASAPARPLTIETRPYPGFPTDMQAQMMSLLAVGGGVSRIRENVFENRYMHVAELRRMGADITVRDRTAVIRGVKRLAGAPVMASDLRASAALVLAGLAARGRTDVHRVYHLDRGYEEMDRKLRQAGAHIGRRKAAML